MILALNLLAVGPSFLDGVGLDVPLFCYIDPLPDIDHCHDVHSAVCNIVNDSKTNTQNLSQSVLINRSLDSISLIGWQRPA